MNALTLLPLDHASFTRVGFSNLGNALDGIEEERQSRINDVLLPQQRERLNQISFQETLRERGDGAVLADETIAKLRNESKIASSSPHYIWIFLDHSCRLHFSC